MRPRSWLDQPKYQGVYTRQLVRKVEKEEERMSERERERQLKELKNKRGKNKLCVAINYLISSRSRLPFNFETFPS